MLNVAHSYHPSRLTNTTTIHPQRSVLSSRRQEVERETLSHIPPLVVWNKPLPILAVPQNEMLGGHHSSRISETLCNVRSGGAQSLPKKETSKFRYGLTLGLPVSSDCGDWLSPQHLFPHMLLSALAGEGNSWMTQFVDIFTIQPFQCFCQLICSPTAKVPLHLP
jgi:hypothetical protein